MTLPPLRPVHGLQRLSRPRARRWAACAVLLTGVVVFWPALVQAQTPTQAGNAADAQAPSAATSTASPALRMPTPAELGVEVPRQVRAATALLGLGRQRLALVVGNARLGPREVLDSAYRDSRAVAAALRAAGFIVMAREDLTARDLRASLLEFRSRLQPGGIGFLYVAALGAQVDGQNLLLPRDLELQDTLDANALAEQLKSAGVPVTELVDALMSTPDSPRMLVLDAAYQHPVLARLPAPGLAEQRLPPGLMALFGHALHSVKDVPAVAPLAEPPPDDPRDIAASTFGRVLVGAMVTARIKPPDMLRRTRSALFDASGGEMAPWLGGETADDEEFAEAPITALLPTTPEELAREAVRRVVRNLFRVQGAGTASAALVPPVPTAVAAAGPPAAELGVDGLRRGSLPAPADLPMQSQAADGKRQPLRHSSSPDPAAPTTDSLPGSVGQAVGTVGSALGTAASVAGTVATVAAGVKAAETLLMAQAAGTAATAAVGAVGTAGSLLANAVALGSRGGAAGGAEPVARATLQAATTAVAPAGPVAPAATAGATSSTANTAAATTSATTAATSAGSLSAATAASSLAAAGRSAPPDPAPGVGESAAPAGAGAAASRAVPPAAATSLASTAASALAPEAPSEPLPSGPPALPPPKINAFGYGEGDTFLYQVTDQFTEQVTGSFMHAIEQVAADGSLSGNGELLRLDPQGRLQSVQRPDGTQARFEPYQDLWQAAPKPGQAREVRFKERFQRPDGSRGEIDWQGSSEVGAPEKLRVAGGEFEALPIKTAGRFVETVEGAKPTNGRWRRTVWYAPSLGHPVAIDIHDIDLNGRAFRRQRIELVNAQRQRTQP